MGEKDLGVQHSSNVFVFRKLGPVVGGDGVDVLLERAQHLDDKPGHSLCVLAFGGFCHDEFLGGALNESDDGSLAVLAYDGVHLPVSEACLCIDHGRPLLDAHAVLDGDVRAQRPSSVFELMRKVGVELPSPVLVSPDNVVYPFNRDTCLPAAVPDADNSLRRPMPLEAVLDLPPVLS